MATIVHARTYTIRSLTHESFTNASTTAGSIQTSSTTLIARDADTKEWTSNGLESQYHPTWVGWRSDRVDAEVTISGNITLRAQGLSSVAGAGRFYWKLFKRTAGGSNVDTLIAEVEDDVDIGTTSAVYNRIVTLPASVTLAHGERLLYRIYVKRRSADFDTATFTLRYNHSTTGVTRFDLTETVTFLSNTSFLYTRRTTVAAIGNFFDLLPTIGVSASTTGVVNTTASGTEIQWTRTAGGTVLEWITPRFKGLWVLVSPVQFAAAMTAHESNIAANCSVRLKVFSRRPDGTETLILTSSYATELTTTASLMTMPLATLAEEVHFAEDDRLVVRAYIIPIGTMGGSRTCTIGYDHLDSAVGATSFGVTDLGEFKAEGDPGAAPAPSGLSMMGMGT